METIIPTKRAVIGVVSIIGRQLSPLLPTGRIAVNLMQSTSLQHGALECIYHQVSLFASFSDVFLA